MTKILLTYGTTEGQTAKIADFVRDVLTGRGCEVTLRDIHDTDGQALAAYDGVVVGSSVHRGHHDRNVVAFVERHRDALSAVPSAFFSVSLAAHGDAAEAGAYVEEFERATGWRPDRTALFGGALLYTQYGFVKRHMMRRIARDKPGDLGTDTSRDYVYTEWDGVRRFAEDFAGDLEPRTGGEGPVQAPGAGT
jgi:menaquinone-dependent protoporphyrinogen oxidase